MITKVADEGVVVHSGGLSTGSTDEAPTFVRVGATLAMGDDPSYRCGDYEAA